MDGLLVSAFFVFLLFIIGLIHPSLIVWGVFLASFIIFLIDLAGVIRETREKRVT